MSLRRERYLFIRILEACNANCFMCDFALSSHPGRFSLEELEQLLPQARALGIQYVRFTGGEPLMHRQITALIAAGRRHGMKMSIITNGAQLSRLAGRLAEAGLDQVIVSLDGASSERHDHLRGTPGLFARAIDGLRAAAEVDIMTRVNTVVGPHNYTEMPALQRLLASLQVSQWELSALKLGRPIRYPDPQHVQQTCEPLYTSGHPRPMGKRFFGEDADERSRFFSRGIAPRASAPRCNLIGQVIYLEPVSGNGYGCSLLPHRAETESLGGARLRTDGRWVLDTAAFRDHVSFFQQSGPRSCTGCSTTAAGYSDAVAQGTPLASWSY